MKKLILVLGIILIGYTSCNEQAESQVIVNQPRTTAVVTPDNGNIGNNLNLQALGELVKKSNNAQEIEEKLNQANSINNLDLDGDGKVDYIKVTEYGQNGIKGFSFTVDLANGQKQEVATVELQQVQGQQNATMNIQGNQTIYGPSAYSSSNYLLTDLLIWHYLWYPHPFYCSPWHWGYYPRYYRPYVCVSRGYYSGTVGYMTRTSTIRRTSVVRSSSISPNRSLSSSVVSSRVSSMSSPTRSQRSFTTTSNSRPSTNGFKSSSFSSHSSSHSSGSSYRSSGSSRSFGSSSRSFGGSRRSDMRFKTNIRPINGQLSNVIKLTGVKYEWRVDEFPFENFDTARQIGFIAQDLEKVYPEVVETRKDGYKTVNYDLLVPVLVEAIKELNNKLNRQEVEIKMLRAKRCVQDSNKIIGGKI